MTVDATGRRQPSRVWAAGRPRFFTPDRVWMKTAAGKVVQERQHPLRLLRGPRPWKHRGISSTGSIY